MNKEELIKELNLHRNIYSNDLGFGSGVKAGLKLAIIKIGKLDEPEKVIVPKFVADEFDYDKNYYWEVDESNDISHILKCAFGNDGKPSEFLGWVRDNPENYVMAVRNGYEVEKEKLYYVLDKHGKTLLMLMDGEVWPSGGHVLSESIFTKDMYQLTEKQIKDYDERFWQFAVKVQE